MPSESEIIAEGEAICTTLSAFEAALKRRFPAGVPADIRQPFDRLLEAWEAHMDRKHAENQAKLTYLKANKEKLIEQSIRNAGITHRRPRRRLPWN